VVLAADASDTPRAQAALARLCQTYWYPLYAYVRRRGHGAADAQDLTQEFFARLLEQNWLAQADRQRGRFRTFLLSAMSHFLANQWHKDHTQKRGGFAQFVSLDIGTAETRYAHEPLDPHTPEEAYERRWVLALLDHVLERLREEHASQNKTQLFEALKPCLVGDRQGQPYAALALQLQLSEAALKVTVHRLRRRYRQLLRDEIAHTVASPNEVEEELRYLFVVLAR